MRLATLAAVMLVITAAGWVAFAIIEHRREQKQCMALQQTVEGLNGALEFVAAHALVNGEAEGLRARKVDRPGC